MNHCMHYLHMIEPNKAGFDTTIGFQGGHAQWKHNGFQKFKL